MSAAVTARKAHKAAVPKPAAEKPRDTIPLPGVSRKAEMEGPWEGPNRRRSGLGGSGS
jgi:hypothetical protein